MLLAWAFVRVPWLLAVAVLACAPARILFVSSGGMYTERLAVDDLQSREGTFSGPVAYSRSKRAEVAICEGVSRIPS